MNSYILILNDFGNRIDKQLIYPLLDCEVRTDTKPVCKENMKDKLELLKKTFEHYVDVALLDDEIIFFPKWKDLDIHALTKEVKELEFTYPVYDANWGVLHFSFAEWLLDNIKYKTEKQNYRLSAMLPFVL